MLVLEETSGDPPPARRHPAWLRRGLPLLTAVAVGLLLRLAGAWGPAGDLEASSPPSSGGPPTAVAVAGREAVRLGAGWRCPPGAEIAAYRPGNHYYPPNHPLLPPPDRRPTSCFRSVEGAQMAGYGEGLPPLGSEVVGGIYVVPLDRQAIIAQCHRAAGRLGFAVVCPLRLPSVPVGDPPPGCTRMTSGPRADPPCVWGSAFLLDEGRIALPIGWDAASGGQREPHLTISAYRRQPNGVGPLQPAGLACSGGTVVVRGSVPFLFMSKFRDTTFINCPPGPAPHGSQLIARWRAGGVVYQMGFGGNSEVSRQLLLTVAASLMLVEP